MLSQQTRVLLLELDSLSLSFIRQNLDRLPTMKHLLATGSLVETATTADIASASVWPTFNSGKLPGEHGHYFPFQWHAGDMCFYRTHNKIWGSSLEYEPFWYSFARNGVACQVLDAVQAPPRPDAPCLEINNWSAQSSSKILTSNPEVATELRRRFGKRPIGMEIAVSKSLRKSSSLVSQILLSLKRKTDAILWLGQSRDWRFYLASIQDVHRAGHNLWPVAEEFASDVEPDALLRVYQAMDMEVSRILDAFQDDRTTIFLFTLNGMAANNAQNHFLPQLLSRLNKLYLTGESPGDISTRRNGMMARLRDLVPPHIQYSANRILGEKVQDWVVNREFTGALDWSETPSFTIVTAGEGLIGLNLKGRERNGMLSTKDETCQNYVLWLRDRILDIRVVDTGEPLVSEFIEMGELFPGDHCHLLPDIALKWAPQYPMSAIQSDDIGIIRKKLLTGRGGNHTGESFALITGQLSGSEATARLTHIKDYKDIIGNLLGL